MEQSSNTRLQEYSPLSLMGYLVDAKKDNSAEQRQMFLKLILDMGILSKAQVINYLEYFIDFNGRRSNRKMAVSKWKEDLQLVSAYNLDKQESGVVHSVEKYQK